VPLLYDVKRKCIRVLDDGCGDDDLFTKYNFGSSPELLFKPCLPLKQSNGTGIDSNKTNLKLSEESVRKGPKTDVIDAQVVLLYNTNSVGGTVSTSEPLFVSEIFLKKTRINI